MSTLTESRAQVILSLYPGFHEGIADFRKLPSGLFNENASFVVADRKYVLKKLLSERSRERHNYAIGWQNHLAAEGFPCPRFLPNQEGEFITASEGDHWTVQTWAEGGPLDMAILDGPAAREIMLEVGAALGRLHRLGQAALQSGAVPAAGRSCRVALSEHLAGCRATLSRLHRRGRLRPSPVTLLGWKPFKSATDKEILATLPTVQGACAELDGWDPAAVPGLGGAIPCHGDVNWENLFFQENTLTAVLDFDNALEMDAAYEVAAAAAVICRHKDNLRGWFLEGYTREAEWGVAEEDMRCLMLLKCLKSLLYQIEVAMDGGTGNDRMAREWRRYLRDGIRAYSA